MKLIYPILANRQVLIILFIINLLGTIYGYIWYEPQFKVTPTIFLPFVPDSPTASLFFTIVLFAFILKKNWPLFEALAIVTLFKYGVWAVVMNVLTLIVTGSLPWQGYMLIISHGAMAIEGILYSPFYRIKLKHLVIVAIWTMHNDIIDYVFMQYPKYGALDIYVKEIGYFTFWLSVISLAIAYYCSIRKNRLRLPI
ncbi:membrane protein [Heyndrickxia sporothermodurans]|nr:membrane protein [Heyndrickxia sporothermodurans]